MSNTGTDIFHFNILYDVSLNWIDWPTMSAHTGNLIQFLTGEIPKIVWYFFGKCKIKVEWVGKKSLSASVSGWDQVKSNMSGKQYGHNELRSVLQQGGGKIRCVQQAVYSSVWHQRTWKGAANFSSQVDSKKSSRGCLNVFFRKVWLIVSSWQTSQPQPKLTWFVVL